VQEDDAWLTSGMSGTASSGTSERTATATIAASSIERLDATFVGLCVDHVLDAHSRTALASSHLD